jgi:PTH1 family peptidyl-tRNA hydrolase
MKLLVGLGNPGDKYRATRHNAGFWLVERFAAQTGTVLRKDAKSQALVGRHDASGVWVLLPQSYMNSSGRPVQMLASFFKIAPAEILVVHDELDFPPGVARIKQGGGIAGHNGLKDISARLASHDYWRLRIGIGHPGDRDAVTDYVLHKPSQEDRAAIEGAIDRALEVLPIALAGNLQDAMLKLHTRDPIEPPPKPEKLEHPRQAANTAADEMTGKAEKAGKKGAFGTLLKKLLPDPDAAPKK